MVEQLLNHIKRNNLCKTTDKILLAVSGGVDSMVMLHLFRQTGFKIGVVHCNFQLRGEASMGDEEFVRQTCDENNIPFYVKRFNTLTYAEENRLSIQMAARDLRYSFFDTLVDGLAYDYLATAHHLNDSIETTLLNLVKGTGIDGLSGIPQTKDKVIRPLLFATKEMLMDYATRYHLSWREDVSNGSTDYQRNFIRHRIIPELKALNPNFENTFQYTLQRLTGARLFASAYIDHFAQQALQFTNGRINIDKRKLLKNPAPSVLLWELIKDKGFNFDQCIEIVSMHQSGKKFFTSGYELFVDREYYIIQKKNDNAVTSIIVDKNADVVKGIAGNLYFEIQDKKDFCLRRETELAQLDFDRIEYPLTWRTWQPGDHFIPLGLTQTKKLSDFFIDMKLSMPVKNQMTVIESAGRVIWVVGLRIHNDFKVTEDTGRILTIRFKKNKE